ncbi:MAG: hypothetical protein LBD37_02285 [Treponema sp.]|jgi:molybdopterin-guanine dinucleotide biosynthesis protein|nr:hypothetical protein [Treponema sp.]
MMLTKNLILIGSGGRNSGKTALAEALIRLLAPQYPLCALKVTTVAETGGCHRGEQGCGACAGFSAYALDEEKDRASGKDTSRLLNAGAKPVFWLRSRAACLAEAYAAFLAKVNAPSLIIAESNSLRRRVEPGCFIMVRPPPAERERVKPSAAGVEGLADLTLDSPLPPEAAADLYSRLIIEPADGRLPVRFRRN